MWFVLFISEIPLAATVCGRYQGNDMGRIIGIQGSKIDYRDDSIRASTALVLAVE